MRNENTYQENGQKDKIEADILEVQNQYYLVQLIWSAAA